MLLKPKTSAGLTGHLARIQSLINYLYCVCYLLDTLTSARAFDLFLHSSPSVSSHVIGVNSGERKTSGAILSAGVINDKHSSLHHYITINTQQLSRGNWVLIIASTVLLFCPEWEYKKQKLILQSYAT